MQNTKAQADLLPRLLLPQNVKQAYLELGGLPELDGRYTVFGQVYQGLEIVSAIAAQPTNSEDVPIEPVFIRQINFEKTP
ncbi:peptidylprolyl isomerase [Enterococcus cecorum]|uniref:peptidylprolyl isomerase n=1 Tax=Enterococcus cecorum TaxID=44008 RepID=UPI00148DF76F|nr:peptidylprolyl isomerase [Enterococcus cecorum]MDZ5440475.1 peptidylprolyl isomerase [Enterococcus cecorum]MDZ5549634.1 peptidylprolyl isomerase [Enterococcus cecorum]MDZ5582219.1 peptidylprolyl isomerase [Enterococcus cecorum]